MPDTYSDLLYHVVFSTKHRAPIVTERIRERLYEYVGGMIRSEGGTPLEIGGMEDHIQLLARLEPTLAISEAARLVKAKSSKFLSPLRGLLSLRVAYFCAPGQMPPLLRGAVVPKGWLLVSAGPVTLSACVRVVAATLPAPDYTHITFQRLPEVNPDALIALMDDPDVRRHLPLARGQFGVSDCKHFVAAKERMWDERGYGP